MTKLLVTDLPVEDAGDYAVSQFGEFFTAVTEGDGVDADAIYIDINSVPSEDVYEALSAVDIIEWVDFEGKQPDWFTGSLSTLPEEMDPDALDSTSMDELGNALSLLDYDGSQENEEGQKVGKIITFGSAKGGSGKTFTSLITAVYYAKDHPNERVCILDLDIEEPQLAIVIKVLSPTVKKFYSSFIAGDTSFETLSKCKCNNVHFPSNLDFYLTPRDLHPIQDQEFWECIMFNLFYNYDMVFLDTGTTYMETPAIISAYKIADKVNIVSMANLASTVTVGNQIKRLTGQTENNVYSAEDGIADKLNLIITNAYNDIVCNNIIDTLARECPVIAKFGNLTQKINEIQVLSKWDALDDDIAFRESVKTIYSC